MKVFWSSMASQLVCGNEPLEVFEFKSYIMATVLSKTQLGDVLPIKWEPTILKINLQLMYSLKAKW